MTGMASLFPTYLFIAQLSNSIVWCSGFKTNPKPEIETKKNPLPSPYLSSAISPPFIQTLILKIHEHWSSLGASEKAKVPPALLSQIHSYLSQGKGSLFSLFFFPFLPGPFFFFFYISLKSFSSLFKVANQGGNVVMEKLTKAYAASCVRTFPLSYPSFVSDVSNLLSASPQNPPLLRAVIDIFRHFPEEMSIVHISSNQRGNMETQFLSQVLFFPSFFFSHSFLISFLFSLFAFRFPLFSFLFSLFSFLFSLFVSSSPL